MEAPKINGKIAECFIELKDGRYLLKYNNGFSYYVQSAKGEISEITENYFKEQLRKHRITKRIKNQKK